MLRRQRLLLIAVLELEARLDDLDEAHGEAAAAVALVPDRRCEIVPVDISEVIAHRKLVVGNVISRLVVFRPLMHIVKRGNEFWVFLVSKKLDVDSLSLLRLCKIAVMAMLPRMPSLEQAEVRRPTEVVCDECDKSVRGLARDMLFQRIDPFAIVGFAAPPERSDRVLFFMLVSDDLLLDWRVGHQVSLCLLHAVEALYFVLLHRK